MAVYPHMPTYVHTMRDIPISTNGASVERSLRWGKDIHGIHPMQYFSVVADWSDFGLL